MKIKYLILVCLVISSSIAFADIATVNPASVNGRYYWGYGAAEGYIRSIEPSEARSLPYPSGAFTSPDSHLVAFSKSEAGTNVEWRVSVGFDVRQASLGLPSNAEIVSAALKFDTAGWVFGRDHVTVDQTVSYLVGEDPWDFMYGYRLATGIVANGAAAGSHSVDITSAFLTAMNNASAAGGMSFVWYCDNDADPTSPYIGSPDWISYSTGYTVDNAVIEITYRVSPTACGAPGTIYLTGDLNHDCKVDFADFAVVAAGWMGCTTPEDENCSGWYNE